MMNKTHTFHSKGDEQYEELIEKIAESVEAGEPVDLDAYLAEHPQYADRLARAVPAMQAMFDLGLDSARGSSQEARSGAPLNGTLGDYRIVREVGRGGMGVVYEAEQVSLGRPVALKVLPFASMLDDRHRLRFQNEARAAATLEHPHIVPVYGVGQERGVHYYAMKLVRGSSLAEVLKELQREGDPAGGRRGSLSDLTESLLSGRLSPDRSIDEAADSPAGQREKKLIEQEGGKQEASQTQPTAALSTERSHRRSLYYRRVAELGVQAAGALDHAHAVGITHRDIKPGNLLLDTDGRCWIADFGLAHVETGATLTRTGDLMGTLRYMSPEQVQGEPGLVDSRSDIYGLGITLYELLTLEPAFTGDDRPGLIRTILEDDPPRPRQVNPAIPRDLETIVLKAIDKDPEYRYISARHLGEDLQRFLSHEPVQARRPGMLQFVGKWSQRNQPILWSALLVLVLAVVGFAVSTVLVLKQKRQANEALELAQHQKQTARQNAERAAENLQLAMEAVDEIYTEMSDNQLQATPNSQALRKRMLEKALKFYLTFAEKNSTAGLQFETAMAWRRMGEIYHRFQQNDKAQKSLLKAISTLKALATRYPDQPRYRRELASAYWFLSKPLEVTHQFEPGEAYCREALKMQRRLVEQFPGDPQHKTALAVSRHQLDHLLGHADKTDEAAEAFRGSVLLFRELLDESPQDPVFARQLAHGHTHLGSLLHRAGKLAQAEEKYRKSLEIVDGLEGSLNADVVDSQHAILAGTCRRLGEVLREMERYVEAESTCRKAVRLNRELARAFPAVVYYQAQLALSNIALGKTLRSAGSDVAAEETFDSAHSILEALSREFPDHKIYSENLRKLRDLMHVRDEAHDRS